MAPPHTLLHQLADIALLRGRAAEAANLRTAANAPDLDDPRMPEAVRETLVRLRQEGVDALIEEALALVPRDVAALARHHPDDLPHLARLTQATAAVSAGDLAVALAEPRPELVPDPVRARLQATLPTVRDARPQTPLGRAWHVLDGLLTAVRARGPEIVAVEVVGSTRRHAAFSRDLEVVVASRDPRLTAARLLAPPLGAVVLHAGPSRVMVRVDRTEIGLHLVTPDRLGVALVVLTGSPSHVAALRARAAARGLRLAPLGPSDGGISGATESEVYAQLGLPFIAPELREDDEAIAAAEAGRLPALVTGADMRGDLHMHSDWSDGHDPLEAMIEAACGLGYEYVAVTDHSASSAIARGLDADRLARQRDAVAAARERFPDITILHGAEVDILADGSLDFPDHVLETLDVVLASLHDPGTDSGERLTDRYVAAMRHPLVQIVTHPTNRLVPGRAGYALDEGRLFATAVETGTFLEIDGAPGHLDMDGAMARRAIAAGVDVTIDGDCHRAAWLGRQMAFGVATARRGWVEARHVANTRRLPELQALLRRKRGRS